VIVAVLVTVSVLSGCWWSQPGFGPQHRRHNTAERTLTIDNVDTLTELWSSALPGADTEPIFSEGRVYVTRSVTQSSNGGVWVTALTASDGSTVWERQLTAGQPAIVAASPNSRFGDLLSSGYLALVGGQCVAGHGDLNPDDGSGDVATDGLLLSPAVTSESVVVRTSIQSPCSSSAMSLRASDLESGAGLWSASLASNARPPVFMPTVADGRVYVTGVETLSAYRLNGCGAATCAPVWSTNLGINADVSTPVAGNEQVFVVASDGSEFDGQLIALAAGTGAEQWRANLDWSRPLLNAQPMIAVAGNTVYVTTGTPGGDNLLRAYHAGGCGAATCDPVWTATLEDSPSPPTVAGGVVYVGTTGVIHAYDAAGCGAAACSPMVDIPVQGWAGNLSVSDGKLFAAGGGWVTAFTPEAPTNSG
jgi:outer membrane protein assembly factor BamB